VQTGSGGPLPEYDCGSSSGPQSSQFTPAGQVDGVQEEDWSSTVQFASESDRLDHSLQNDTLQESQGIAEASDIVAAQSATTFECNECSKTFSKRHLLNKHMKKHFPPFQCDDCGKAFQFRKDLRRHCEALHLETVEGATVLFCPFPECKFSAERSAGSTRRDNLNRHIQTRHS